MEKRNQWIHNPDPNKMIKINVKLHLLNQQNMEENPCFWCRVTLKQTPDHWSLAHGQRLKQSPTKQYTLEKVTNKSFLVPDGQLDHKAIQEVSTSSDHQSSTGSAGNTPCALLHANLKLPKGLSLFCPPSCRQHCEQERPGRRLYCLISLQKKHYDQRPAVLSLL